MGEERGRNGIYPYEILRIFNLKNKRFHYGGERQEQIFILSCAVLTKCYDRYFITTAELLQSEENMQSAYTQYSLSLPAALPI